MAAGVCEWLRTNPPLRPPYVKGDMLDYEVIVNESDL